MKKYNYLIPFIFFIPLGIFTIKTGYSFYYEQLAFFHKYHIWKPHYHNIIMGIGLCATFQVVALNISINIKNKTR
jgi:hypothetical protein